MERSLGPTARYVGVILLGALSCTNLTAEKGSQGNADGGQTGQVGVKPTASTSNPEVISDSGTSEPAALDSERDASRSESANSDRIVEEVGAESTATLSSIGLLLDAGPTTKEPESDRGSQVTSESFSEMVRQDAGTPTASDTYGQCDTPDTSCGGDPVGTWEFAGSCVPMSSEDVEKVVGVSCPTSSGVATIDGDQWFTLTEDGAFITSEIRTGVATYLVDIPKACVSNGDCSSLAINATDTVTERAELCQLTMTRIGDIGGNLGDPGTYSTQGNQITEVGPSAIEESGTFSSTWEYCVKGDVMAWGFGAREDGVSIFYMLSRVH